jgi:hypothetical protein
MGAIRIATPGQRAAREARGVEIRAQRAWRKARQAMSKAVPAAEEGQPHTHEQSRTYNELLGSLLRVAALTENEEAVIARAVRAHVQGRWPPGEMTRVRKALEALRRASLPPEPLPGESVGVRPGKWRQSFAPRNDGW